MMARRVIDLNGDAWQFGSVPQQPFRDTNDAHAVEEWLPARVPGDARLDLLRAGKIPDPFWGENNESSQWVDGRDWWYRRQLDLPREPGDRAFLIFEGIDYQSAVFADERLLGRHAGMFSRQLYELPGSRAGIAVRIWGSDALPKMRPSFAQKLWGHLLRPLFTPPNSPFPDRYATLKCQMQFGWDFAPRLRTCGIWDDAYVVVVRSVLIEDVCVRASASPGDPRSPRAQVPPAAAKLSIMLDSDREQDVRLVIACRGKNFAVDPQVFQFGLHLALGRQTVTVTLEVRQPRQWNPWDRGDPNLYELDVQLFPSGSSKSLDAYQVTFGIRRIDLAGSTVQARNAEPWNFIINDRREFIRGVNWVPLDAIPARVTREAYAERLKQARDANVNFVRVWGGGLREKRAFYDLCDVLGILVWQEFPFAGAVLDRFPRDREFLASVRDECSAIVRELRNHPSLVVWCGGNEFNTRGNSAIVKTLQAVVQEHDGTRPFKPASPCRGESHNWRVWHRGANLADYRKDDTLFMSEFGLQSAPDVPSLKRFMPEDRLFPPNALWEYHHAQLEKLWRYARPALASLQGRVTRLEDLVKATQRAQALGVQIAVEHMRRRKAKLEAVAPRAKTGAPALGQGTAGVAVWQFNDAWPAISWAVIDYYGRPKRAYADLCRLYAPVLASFDYPQTSTRAPSQVTGDLWLINDWIIPLDDVEWRAELNGIGIATGQARLAPDSTERVSRLSVPLEQGKNLLTLQLRREGELLSENEYDLSYRDHGEMNPLIALLYPIYHALMR